jgi:hypothetical protein
MFGRLFSITWERRCKQSRCLKVLPIKIIFILVQDFDAISCPVYPTGMKAPIVSGSRERNSCYDPKKREVRNEPKAISRKNRKSRMGQWQTPVETGK